HNDSWFVTCTWQAVLPHADVRITGSRKELQHTSFQSASAAFT
ncbi:hypothetical protein HaLaN_01356, partial [Haematococcus lacustris]